MSYIYQADIYCDACGRDIINRLRNEGIIVEEDDSDSYPQYDSSSGEADCPQHCGSGAECLNALELSDGTKVGEFLENSLTDDGREYVRDTYLERPTEVSKMWAEHYGIKMPEPEYDDLVTSDYKTWHYHGSSKSFEVREDNTWMNEVKWHMQNENYWPNCWYQGERGDWNLLDLDKGGFAE